MTLTLPAGDRTQTKINRRILQKPESNAARQCRKRTKRLEKRLEQLYKSHSPDRLAGFAIISCRVLGGL